MDTKRASSRYIGALLTALLLGALSFASSCGSSTNPTKTQNLYVTEYGVGGPVAHVGKTPARPAFPTTVAATPGVLLFPLTASGDVAPTTAITGTSTTLGFPTGSAFDASGNIYVTNLSNNSVTVYAAGASGDIAPISTIIGTSTGLNNPEGIALDIKGNIYVANYGPTGGGPGSVTIFGPGASGDIAPLSTISGSNTMLVSPFGVALDAEGKIYVANGNSSVGVAIFGAGASGDVAPLTAISVNGGGVGIALDASGNIYVDGGSPTPSVIVYPAGATSSSIPIATISGSNTTLNNPTGVAVAANGDIFVADLGADGVLVFGPGANGNIAPVATISGTNTQIIGPRGVTVH
jgi:hypothetical protein